MPVHKKDNYYQWGHHGKKYLFNPSSKASMIKAKKKAVAQGVAIILNKKR